MKTFDEIREVIKALQSNLPKKDQETDEQIEAIGEFEDYVTLTESKLCKIFPEHIGIILFNRLQTDPQIPAPLDPPASSAGSTVSVNTGHKVKIPPLKEFDNKVTPWALAVKNEINTASFPNDTAKVLKAAEGLTNGSIEKNKWLNLKDDHKAKTNLDELFDFIRETLG